MGGKQTFKAPAKMKIPPEVKMPGKILERGAIIEVKRISRTMTEAAYANCKLNRNRLGEMVALNPFYRGESKDGDYYNWLNEFYDGKMPPIVRRINQFRGFPQNDDPRFNPASWRKWKAYYRSPEFLNEFAAIKPHICVYIATCGPNHADHVNTLDSYHGDLRSRGHCKAQDLLLGRKEASKILDLELAEEVERLSTPPSIDNRSGDVIEGALASPTQYHGSAGELMAPQHMPESEEYEQPPTPQYHSPAGELMVPQHIPESEDYGSIRARSNIDNLAAEMGLTSPPNPPSEPLSPAYGLTSPLNPLSLDGDGEPGDEAPGSIFDSPRAPSPYYGPPTSPEPLVSPYPAENDQSPEAADSSDGPVEDGQLSSTQGDSGGPTEEPLVPGPPYTAARALGMEDWEAAQFNQDVRVQAIIDRVDRERYHPQSPGSGASFTGASLPGAVQNSEPPSGGGISVEGEPEDDPEFFQFPNTPCAGGSGELASASVADQESESGGSGSAALHGWSDGEDKSRRPDTPYPFGVGASSSSQASEPSGSGMAVQPEPSPGNEAGSPVPLAPAKRRRAYELDSDSDSLDAPSRPAKRRKGNDSDEDYKPTDASSSPDVTPIKGRAGRRGGRGVGQGGMR